MKRLINNLKHTGWPLLLLLAILATSTVTSCKDDEKGNGTPVISYIRVTDPALADSTFTDVNQGTTIAVIGENLSGVMEVYINGQEINFNSTYSTPTSLILTIPYEDSFQLCGPNPDLPAELRIVTNHGTAVFPLHVLSPGPGITRIAATYPLKPGDEISLIGENFYEIQHLYFTTDSVNVTYEITDYQVSDDFQELTFPVSNEMMADGWIVLDCYTSDASTEFSPNGPKPVITSISSIMPVVGSEVTITGQNFINVSSININGEFDIPGENVTISETFDELTFIMPQAPTQSGHISITAIGGTTEMDNTVFYPVENVVLDYDGIGSFNWGNEISPLMADGSAAPYTSTGYCAGINGTLDINGQWWWQQFINTANWVSTDIIPDYTPIADLELQYECYLGTPMEGPVIEVTMGHPNGNGNFTLTNYVPVNDFTGESETGKWMQCSIPLTSLVQESTWGDFVANSDPTDNLDFYINYPSFAGNVNVEIYVDNFRIVPIQ